jgi:hypothetical protein
VIKREIGIELEIEEEGGSDDDQTQQQQQFVKLRKDKIPIRPLIEGKLE